MCLTLYSTTLHDLGLYGFVKDEKEDNDDNSSSETGLVDRDPIRSAYAYMYRSLTGGNLHNSGYPPSLYESTRDMLLSGFSPKTNSVLRDKLKYILKTTITSFLDQHIPVPMSAEAFIAPGEHSYCCETIM